MAGKPTFTTDPSMSARLEARMEMVSTKVGCGGAPRCVVARAAGPHRRMHERSCSILISKYSQ